MNPPGTGASGSWTRNMSRAVPLGVPDHERGGIVPAPAQVYWRGIVAPFANAVLVNVNGDLPVVGVVCDRVFLLPLLHAAASTIAASALLHRRAFVILAERIDGDRFVKGTVFDVEPEPAEIRDDRVHVDAGASRNSAENPVMGDDAEHSAADVREGTQECSVETGEDRVVVFTTGRRAQFTVPPLVAHPRPAFVDLGAGAAFPLAAVAFTESLVGDDRHLEVRADDLGRARRSPQVGAVNDARAEALARELRAATRGLGLAAVGQGCVEPALPAFLDVPLGFTVSEDQHRLHGMQVKQMGRGTHYRSGAAASYCRGGGRNWAEALMRIGRIGRAVVGASLLAVVLAGCDWTAFRGGAARTGYNGGENGVTTANASSLHSVMTIPDPGPAPSAWNSNPAVASGGVYVLTTDGSYDYAERWDIATHSRSWHTLPGARSGARPAAPAIDVDHVYAAVDSDGAHVTVTSLAAATGAVTWSVTLSGFQIAGSPVVDGGKVFVATTDGNVYALDPATGATLWSRSPSGYFGQSAPAVANGVVYIGDSVLHRFWAFRAADGTTLAGWPRTDANGVGGVVAVTGGKVLSGGSNLRAYDATTGALVWTAHDGAGDITSASSAPAVANGKVYFGTSDGHLHVVDLQTGAQLSDLAGADASKSVSVTDNVLYTVGDGFHAVDPVTGAFLNGFPGVTLGVKDLEIVPANNAVVYSSGGTYVYQP